MIGRVPDADVALPGAASRPVIIAGNWKMNTTPADAAALATQIERQTRVAGVERVICPPYVCLAAVRDALTGTGVGVGAQNVHHALAGAFTGEISAQMLVGLATWAIVGHSERRRDQGETDAQIGVKLARCAEVGLRPILCVGEQLDDREAGRAEHTVRAQLQGSLSVAAVEGGITGNLVIAYEPVWAIGTGMTARGSDAATMAEVIRGACADLGVEWAERIPVLYGGSVTNAAIGEFLAEPSIDGALVGGASLKVEEMAGIVARAGMTAAARREALDAA
jgi:triosephosphate isomerase (TIM)